MYSLKPVSIGSYLFKGLATISLVCSCSIPDEKRSGSIIDISGGLIKTQGLLPVGLSTIPDNSLKVGSEDSCPSIASILQSHLSIDSEDNLMHHFAQSEVRGQELETRIKDHYVPCLESPSTLTATNITDDLTISANLNCYLNFPNATNTIAQYEQFSLGKTSEGNIYTVNRIGSQALLVRSFWLEKTQNHAIDGWQAKNASLTAKGQQLSHLSTNIGSNTLEYTTIGQSQFTEQNYLACGVHLKSNSDYLYITGKLSRLDTDTCTSLATSCDSASTVSYCLNSATLESTEQSLCDTAGLTDFSIPTLDITALENPDFSDNILVDFAETLPRFSMEGLQVQ